MKFFSGTRRQLFIENKFSRYLIYAIGEIVLVVIGILLALQIDTWHETIEVRKSEQTYLKGLRDELKANFDNLSTAISYQERSQNAAFRLLEIYARDYREINGNELDSLFAEVQWTWTFDPRISVLNSIKITGQISTIQNLKLQSFITSFEEVVKDSEEEGLIVRSLIIDRYVPLVSKYISLNNRVRHIGYKEIGGTKFKSDYARLFEDREAESLISYIYIWTKEQLAEEKDILHMIAECISIVENEIDK